MTPITQISKNGNVAYTSGLRSLPRPEVHSTCNSVSMRLYLPLHMVAFLPTHLPSCDARPLIVYILQDYLLQSNSSLDMMYSCQLG